MGESYINPVSGGGIAAGRYTLPAYARGAAVNEWIILSGTSLNAWSNADKPPNIPYSGMAWREDARQIMLACIGGHGDSSWNGVVSIDMGQDSPGWTIRNAPSLSVNRITDSAYYTDGLPSSRHTYQNNHWVPQKNRLMMMGARFVYGSAVSFNKVDSFNPDSNTWDVAGTNADCLSNLHAVDPATGNAFGVTDYDGYLWTRSTDTHAQHHYGGASGVGSVTWDSTNNWWVSFGYGDNQGGGSGYGLFKYSADGTTRTTVALNSSAGLTDFIASAPAYGKLIHDELTGKYLFYDGYSGRSQKVWAITPNGSTAWDITVLSVTGITPAAAPADGNCGRFIYSKRLRGVLLIPNYSADICYLRTA